MKGKIVFFVKRWWVLMLVMTLALSLTSCSKRRTLLDIGYTACDGTIGRFDAYVAPDGAGNYELIIIPIQLVVNGPLLMIGIVSTLDNSYRVVETEVVGRVDAELAYRVTYSDIFNFDRIYIRPANGSAFNDLSNVAADAACVLPIPENLTNATGSGNVF